MSFPLLTSNTIYLYATAFIIKLAVHVWFPVGCEPKFKMRAGTERRKVRWRDRAEPTGPWMLTVRTMNKVVQTRKYEKEKENLVWDRRSCWPMRHAQLPPASAAFCSFPSLYFLRSQVARRHAELTMCCRCWATTIIRTIDPNHNGGALRLLLPPAAMAQSQRIFTSGSVRTMKKIKNKERKRITQFLYWKTKLSSDTAYANKLGRWMPEC